MGRRKARTRRAGDIEPLIFWCIVVGAVAALALLALISLMIYVDFRALPHA